MELAGREGESGAWPFSRMRLCVRPRQLSQLQAACWRTLSPARCVEVTFTAAHLQVSTSEMALGWRLRKLVQRSCLSKMTFVTTALCSTYVSTGGSSGIIFSEGSLFYTSWAVSQREESALKVLGNLDEQMVNTCCLPPRHYLV